MQHKKILFIGPLPPPIGGVSIHILRLSKLLTNFYDIDYIDESKVIKKEYFNLRSLNFFKYLSRIRKADLVYLHSGNRLLVFIHLITCKIFRKKTILTLHGYPFTKKSFLVRLDELIYPLSDVIIVVSDYILKRISLPPHKILVKHAFIPPQIEEEPELPEYLNRWICGKKNSGNLILSANAYQLRIYNSFDLYGVDMCIEAADDLIKKGFPLCFIINVSTIEKNRELFEKYKEEIRHRKLEKNFLLINEEFSFPRLITYSDIILRPTNSDGDALTIREAIYFGKPVISSDVVQRPPETILFHNRDKSDFRKKIEDTLTSIKLRNLHVNGKHKSDYLHFYKNLIDNVLS